MARKSKTTSDTKLLSDEGLAALPPKMRRHIRRLGLDDWPQYCGWCRQHGFDTNPNKHKRLLSRELSIVEQADKEVARYRPRKKLEKHAWDLFRGNAARTEFASASASNAYRLACDRFGSRKENTSMWDAFADWLELLKKANARFLQDSVAKESLAQGGCSFLETLVLLFSHREHWVRSPERWRPGSRNAKRQLRQLIHHLLDIHMEAPAFLDAAWGIVRRSDGRQNQIADQHRDWFRSIGAGHGVSQIEFPSKMTKASKRAFLSAPGTMTVDEAIRWSQIRGLRGDQRLAAAVASTRLVGNYANDSFWYSVLEWFAAHPMLEPSLVGPLIDYLNHMRFEETPQWDPVEQRVVSRVAAPRLSMKGRSPESLLTQMETWHRRLRSSNSFHVPNWESCGIEGFEWTEGREDSQAWCVWTIRELRSSTALAVEGRALRHCVASYSQRCARGATSIWTLEKRTRERLQKCLTVEVVPSLRTIIQARGKCNRLRTPQEENVLHRWCQSEGLTLRAT
ncbi:MAG: PcfJ domain-containing protein [Planctomycetota bacterium]